MARPRVLILAEDCNPQWPSLPIVGYNYARALGRAADITLVTHVRNRDNIEAAGDMTGPVSYIDTEWLAAPMYKLARALRGGDQVAWSTSQMMAYLPYLAFEHQTLRRFRPRLAGGEFDLVHRITPMSPTLPSPMAGRTRQPFVIGPLNGNLDWPAAYAGEQRREKERLRALRGAYRLLPYARRTWRRAACVLAAFQHTIDDLTAVDPARIVSFPEIGIDPAIFHAKGRRPAFSGPGPFRFLYAGRLVPYKLPEAAIRAFATAPALAGHRLSIIGDGPERPRLEAMVAEAGAADRIVFEGRKSQAEVADAMREADAFVFPSIRELGAGVVIEAMACGMVCLVADYGAPGALVAEGRGIAVPLAPLEDLIVDLRAAMERCVTDPAPLAGMVARAQAHAARFDWDEKARYTAQIYEAVLAGRPLGGFAAYA